MARGRVAPTFGVRVRWTTADAAPRVPPLVRQNSPRRRGAVQRPPQGDRTQDLVSYVAHSHVPELIRAVPNIPAMGEPPDVARHHLLTTMVSSGRPPVFIVRRCYSPHTVSPEGSSWRKRHVEDVGGRRITLASGRDSRVFELVIGVPGQPVYSLDVYVLRLCAVEDAV